MNEYAMVKVSSHVSISFYVGWSCENVSYAICEQQKAQISLRIRAL